jgi:signal transduction histidine kinase
MSVDPVLRLIEVTRSLSAMLDREQLVESILVQSAEMLGAERGYLILIDSEDPAQKPSELFQIRATYQLKPEEIDAHEFRASRSTILKVIETGQPQYKQDALNEQDRSRSIELFGLRSILCEPLKVGPRLVGVLYLDSRVHNRFSPWCREILPSLAAQAAICIENANLVAQREAALRREHAELMHAREMEAWKNAVAAFVSVASHDLKGPLTALQTGLELLERTHKDQPSQAIFEDMRASLRRARRLVELYLDSSSLEQNQKLTLVKSNVSLRALVQEEADFIFEHLSASKRQRYTFINQIPSDLLALVDRERMAQILSNLLENAVKYGLGEIVASASIESGDLVITISDQGPGLNDEEAARVFERHYRAETSAGTRGTGLGLWIVAQLVKSHEGSIDVVPRSLTGQGARFVIRLPILPR